MTTETPLIQFPIGKPAKRALTAEGLATLEDLTQISKKKLLSLHGVGQKAVGILELALQQQGLEFANRKEVTE